jgi:hypothetical protein
MADINQIPVTVVQPGEGEYAALPGLERCSSCPAAIMAARSLLSSIPSRSACSPQHTGRLDGRHQTAVWVEPAIALTRPRRW